MTERVSLQTPLWPTLESWKASGRLRIELPDATIAHSVHLVAHKGTSLRIVVMADGGVVIEDTVLTVKDRNLTTQQAQGILARFASLRHALLNMEEEKRGDLGHNDITCQRRPQPSSIRRRPPPATTHRGHMGLGSTGRFSTAR